MNTRLSTRWISGAAAGIWIAGCTTLLSSCSSTSPGQVFVDQATALSGEGKGAEAETLLRAATETDPKLAEAWFRLGILYEKQERWDEAISSYSQFTSLNPRASFRSEMEGRIAALKRHESEAWAASIVQMEDQLQNVVPEQGTVTVFAFDDQRSQHLQGIGSSMASQLSHDLSQIGGYTLVERRNINALLRELELADQNIIDPETASRPNRMLQTESFVLGSITELSDDQIRIDMSWNFLDGTESIAVSTTGETERFWELQKDLTRELLSGLGRELTAGEWGQIAPSGSRDLAAFIAYGQGLEYEKFGNFADAREAYRQALEEDGSFLAARTALARTIGSSRSVDEFARSTEDEKSTPKDDSASSDQLDGLGSDVAAPGWQISSDPIGHGEILSDILDNLVQDPSVLPDGDDLIPTVPGPPGPPR